MCLHIIMKSQLNEKDPDSVKDWEQGRKGQQRMRWLDGMTNSINGHEFEQTLGDSEGQGTLACCSPWGHKESDTAEWMNNKNVLTSFNTNYCVIQRQLFEIKYK